MNEEFTRLGTRINRRLAHAGDVLSILLIDGLVVATAYGIVRVVSHFSKSGSSIFEIAKTVSEAYFLVIYVIWVGFDLAEFFMEEYKRIRDAGRS
jgi:hypothetical protein